MSNRLLLTAIVYVVSGMIPPLVAVYLFRVRFVGGIWASLVVGLVASFAGGLVDTFFLDSIPDLIPVGNAVDAGPPFIFAIVFTVVFGLVSRSNTA